MSGVEDNCTGISKLCTTMSKTELCSPNWEILQKKEQEKKSLKNQKRYNRRKAHRQREALLNQNSEDSNSDGGAIVSNTDHNSKSNDNDYKNKFGFLYSYSHYGELLQSNSPDKIKKSETEISSILALDCEMIGCGPTGEENLLARVSIVNEFGYCVLDRFVKPRIKVTDYRTEFSGIKEGDLDNGDVYEDVILEVASVIKDKIIIGHSLKNDINVLRISHSKNSIRDTAKYFKTRLGFVPSLKRLCEDNLNVKIQENESSGHSSIEDAQACMKIYLKHKKEWESHIRSRQNKSKQINYTKPKPKN